MGGNAPVGSTEQLNLSPNQRLLLNQVAGSFFNQSNQFGDAAAAAAGKVNTNFNQFAPKLNTDFSSTQPLDAYSRSLIAQGEQGARRNLAATQSDLATKFRNNPALARVIGSQAAANSQLSTNPMTLHAALNQQQRQIQGNQAQLQQTEANANLAGMDNAALAQQLQFQSMPMQTQQGLLATLAALYGVMQPRAVTPQTPAPPASGSAAHAASPRAAYTYSRLPGIY